MLAAHKAKIPPPVGVSVHAEVDLILGDDGYSISSRFNVRVPGVEPEAARALIEEAQEICPYSKQHAATLASRSTWSDRENGLMRWPYRRHLVGMFRSPRDVGARPTSVLPLTTDVAEHQRCGPPSARADIMGAASTRDRYPILRLCGRNQ